MQGSSRWNTSYSHHSSHYCASFSERLLIALNIMLSWTWPPLFAVNVPIIRMVCRRLTVSFSSHREYWFQVDMPTGHFHISCGSVQWAYPLSYAHWTLPHEMCKCPVGISTLICPLDTSTWNVHTLSLCIRLNHNVAGRGGVDFKWSCLRGYCTQASFWTVFAFFSKTTTHW